MSNLILAALVAALTAPAPGRQASTILVPTSGLRLDRSADVRRLDARISRAARKLCGNVSQFDLRGQNLARRCEAEAVRGAAPQRDRIVRLATGQDSLPTGR